LLLGDGKKEGGAGGIQVKEAVAQDGSFAESNQCCGSGMFIPDSGSGLFPIPDPVSRIPDPTKKEEVTFF